MAIFCVSNTSAHDLLLQSGGGSDASFTPGSFSPAYVVERNATNVWISESSSRTLPVWHHLGPGGAVEFRVSLPADGQVRRVVVPFKYAPRHLSASSRTNRQAVVIPPKRRPSRLDGIQQTWVKILAWLRLDPGPRLRSPELVANPKPTYPPTQAFRHAIAPPTDLISPHTPFAERYGIGYSLGTNPAVNRK